MMRRWLLAVWLYGLSLLIASPTWADDSWTLLGVRDGLLHPTIHCLSPTRSGGMLVGTSGGLSHWDGRRWLSYGAGNGLPEGNITAVVEYKGIIWAGSWGGGLGVLRDGRWERYTSADSPLPVDWISDLAADSDGVWIASYGAGLVRFGNGDRTAYTQANSGLPSDWVTRLLRDGEGGLWVGTERAGVAYLGADGRWKRYALPLSDLSRDEVTALALSEGELWVGTRRGIVILNPISGRWRPFTPPQALPSEQITALAARPAGGMWIGTKQGLALWDGKALSTFTVREGLAHDYVSALGVDSTGRLWVGSYVRGLAVQGLWSSSVIARPPVVLVHGWRGPDSDRLEDSEFWHLARWLRDDGFTPYYATGISPKNTLHANAARLREVIAQARRETGAEEVYLIAFSMGGLNSRAYLESSLYQGDVRRAFILGTPHRGEEIWLTFLLWEHLAWSDEPSALELIPMHAELFNRTHNNAWDVPYTLIAGDARSAKLPTLFRELPPSDGLVSTWSALGPEGLAGERRVTDDIHAWGDQTILLDIPSLLLPRATYDAHIRPYLLGVADAPGTGSPFSSHGYVEPVTEARSALRVGQVDPGKSVTVSSIPIEAQGRSKFYIRWQGAPLKVSLRDPRGKIINADNADDHQAEYLELDFADFAGFVLTDTLPGPWSVLIESDARNRAPSQYVAYASYPSPVRLRLATDRMWYQPEEQITISACLDDPQARTQVRQVRVDIYSPSRRVETLYLLPDEQNVARGRGQAYVGNYRLPRESGYYVLLAQAVGERGGHILERGEAHTIGVYSKAAQLNGRYALATGPLDDQGRFQDMRASIGVSVRREGDYLCSIALADPQGRLIARVAHPAHLAQGEHTISVTVPGSRIALAGLDGPYHLAEVVLCDIAGAMLLADVAHDVAISEALQSRNFAPE